MSALLPEQCPRFDACSANICPLDAEWRRRAHRKGERVCGLLAESVKLGGEARLRAYLPAEQVEVVLRQRPAICARWGDVKRRLAQSAKTGSKLEAGQRLRAAAP